MNYIIKLINKLKHLFTKEKFWRFVDYLEPTEFICTFKSNNQVFYGFRFYGEDDYYGEYLTEDGEWILVYGREDYGYLWTPGYQTIVLSKKPNKRLKRYLQNNATNIYKHREIALNIKA